MKKWFLFFLLFLLSLQIYAIERSNSEMRNVAISLLNKQNTRNVSYSDLKEFLSLSKLKVFGYEEGGFVVVTRDDRFDEVIGYSTDRFTDTIPCGLKWWFNSVDSIMVFLSKENTKKTRRQFVTRKTIRKSSISPMLTTKWGQQKPFNNNCNGKSAGCVAVAMAQVMNYYKYPSKGIGKHNNTSFEGHYYDWNSMEDEYIDNNYSDKSASAVATLISDCGQSIDTNYGYSSSSASCADVPAAFRNYFSYNDYTRHYSRDGKSKEFWMGMIYNELNSGRPVIYGGTSSQGGHAFVLHGYDSDGLLYVSWGWNGNYDGYYDIDLLNPDKYIFKKDQELIIVIPQSFPEVIAREINLQKGERLSSKITEAEKSVINSLKISGELNGEDILFLRNMVGFGKNENTYVDGNLTHLDMSEAQIIDSDISYFYRNQDYTLQKNNFPDYMFSGSLLNGGLSVVILPESITSIGRNAFFVCSNLINLVIPSNVSYIGRQAFQYCKHLKNIYVKNPTPPEIAENTFKEVFKSDCILTVPKGSKGLYKSANYWKQFNKIIEEGEQLENQTFEIVLNIGEGGNVIYNNKTLNTGSYAYEVKYNSQMNLTLCPDIWYDIKSITNTSKSVSIERDGNKINILGIDENVTINISFKKSDIAYSDGDENNSIKYKKIDDGNKVSLLSVAANVTDRVIIPSEVTIGSNLYKVTEISNSAFKECRLLKEIVLPQTIKTIGSNPFYGCTNLEYVLLLSDEVPTISKISNNPYIFVPEELYNNYINDEVWRDCFVIALTKSEISDFINNRIIPNFRKNLNDYLSCEVSEESWKWKNITCTLYNNSSESITITKIEIIDELTNRVLDKKEDEISSIWGGESKITTIQSGEKYSTTFNFIDIDTSPYIIWYYKYRNTTVMKSSADNSNTGIKSISDESATDKIFDIHGNILNSLHKGLNIITKDGKTKKVIVK